MIERAKELLEFSELKMEDALSHLQEEMATLRAGKANPDVLGSVMVNYYGAATPLPQMSNITTPDAKTMLIQPWDKSMIHAIEKAIMDANLGFTPQNNGEVIRINIPALTEERRRELVKKSKAAGEIARVSIRNARRDAMEALKKLQKDGLSEDVEKDNEDKVQKATDKFVKKVEEILDSKEKEIMTV